MKNHFDYAHKVLVAVEVNQKPTIIATNLNTYAVFRKLAIEEIKEAFKQTQHLLIRLFGSDRFETLLQRRIKYWEQLEATNRTCFIHYAYGPEQDVNDAYATIPYDGFVLTGVYHIVPQVSAFPFGFPFGDVPNPWYTGEPHPFTDYSVFWLNFFPPQNFLLEKIFRTYVSFAAVKAREGRECNQLVEIDDTEKLYTKGVDQFVQINLNRFTSYDGFFRTAIQAGRHSFIPEEEFIWYGMLAKTISL